MLYSFRDPENVSRQSHKQVAGNPMHYPAYMSISSRPLNAYPTDTRIRRTFPKGIHLKAFYKVLLRLRTLSAFGFPPSTLGKH